MDETLTFWQTLGFKVTYRQKAPNAYGVIEKDGFALHFFGLKELAPDSNFSTCLVIVPEVEIMHGEFVAALRESLGRFPAKGFPRLSRMKPGQSRFTLTDVSGNSVIFIKRGGVDEHAAEAHKMSGQTPLQKAVRLADRLRDFKTDDAMAAKVLDDALARNLDASAGDRKTALAARLELAKADDDTERVGELEQELKRLNN
jgi:hypothetical protein